MTLTHPIYDRVFKFLMGNRRIARTVFVFILLLTVVQASAITDKEARRVAESFVKKHTGAMSRVRSAQDGTALKSVAGIPQGLYAFNAGRSGFVLVSDEGSVVGYSDSGMLDWQKTPQALKDWAEVLSRQPQTTAPSVTRASSRTAVEPMITTIWNQTEPYNAFCPDGAVTGCVATAMAQVMAYHRWPQGECTEIPAYGSYGSLPAVTFGWQQMKNSINAEDTEDAHTAIAQLMRYCGRAVQTVYSSVSFAYEFRIPTALRNFFGYDASVRRVVRSDYSKEEWDEMIYGELAAGRPVIYSGQRTLGTVHEFIVDGYDGQGYYHVNWGWGGQGNGFFMLPALTPGESYTGGGSGSDGYTMDQSAVIGIMPDAGGTAPSYEKSLTVEDFGLMSDVTVYKRNSIDEPFTVDIRSVQGNHGNKSLGCYPGVGLYQGDTKIGVMSGTYSTYDPGSFSGKHWDGIYEYKPYTVIFGAQMTGKYRLIPVCGQGGLVMVTWKPSIGADTHYVDVEMTEETLTLTEHPIRSLKIASVKIEGQEDGVTIGKASVTNEGDEFNGKLYLQVNGKLATGTGLALAEKETAEIAFHFISNEEISDFRIGYWPEGDSWLCEATGSEWKSPVEPVVKPEPVREVTIGKVRPGELGKHILEQTENLSDVESLTIQSGTLNDNDFKLLYEGIRNVRHLDLYGISNTYFPNTGYYSNFQKCDSLRSVRLPKNLDRLGSAYTSDNGTRPFEECASLESIDIPAGVRQLPFYSFSGCRRLREVILHEGLERIGQYAFGDCDSLRTVTLPSTLVQADGAFGGCDNLYEVICLATTPPILKERDLFGYELNDRNDYIDLFMKGRVLTSPKGSNYELTQGWNRFHKFVWTDSIPKDIRVNTEWNLLNELPQNKPNVTLSVGLDNLHRFWYAGKMSVNSSSTLSLGTFNIEQDVMENNIDDFWDPNDRGRYDNTNSRDLCWPTLITQSPMRADTVRTTLRWHAWTAGQSGTQMWAFSSLPFDCKLSDLRITRGGKGMQYAIMKYSGLMRSQAQFNDVWVKQTQDSIIHAGEGFIIAAGWDTVTDMFSDLQFTAVNNEYKNRLFSYGDLSLPLKQYTAAAACDRSWNFIGNPYPCFYSTKYLDPAAPFVVYDRDKGRYQVYSPIDDDYVLHPFEGFFIQKPLGYDEIDFPHYGRFQTIAEYEAWKKDLNSARRKASARTANPNRKVCNISLGDFDKCRLVMNPEASKDYEAGTDATKFPQFDGTHTLLYIIGADDTRYAISEQPFAEGDTLTLGMVIAEDGEYTLAADSTLTLIDHETGNSQTLSQPYSFTAKAGEYNARFAITKTARRGFVTSPQMVTIGDVEYYISTDDNHKNRGVAMVSNINSSNEKVEIPAYITYDGEQYEVYAINTSAVPYDNTTLKHLILPSTITSYFPLSDQYAVTLYALTPPDMSNYYFYDNYQYTLYVPKAVINDYKTTYPYILIKNILPAENESDLLCVQGSNVTMDDNGKPSNKPSIDIRCKSGLTVEGSKTMNLSSFDMEYIIDRSNYGDTYYGNILTEEDNATGTLITSSPMTADKVSVTFSKFNNDDYYRFYCLPFNVRVADIIDNRSEGKLHIYRYNSAQRASGQYGSNWQKVGSGETLKAGEGFIMKAYHDGNYRHFTFPAVDDAKKNDIFATSCTITLTDYPAGKAEDRGWNFVGNPYPAYYDMSQSTLQQPYQLYGQTDGNAYSSDRRYYAYSRDDDDILVRPFEGFFVQYSDTEKSFSMPGSGRYHGYPEFIYEKTWGAARALTRAAEENRRLYDIELTGADIHDRTRIVLNNNAKADFEPECDAVKLDGNDITTLYTVENGIRLAINERPALSGSITLIANITTDGTYTLSLGKHNAKGIVVTDSETGISTQLDTDSYTFTAKTGSRRFSVTFGNGTTGISEEWRVKSEESTAPVYDLQGRKVEGDLKPGVYIRNGRKVIVK